MIYWGSQRIATKGQKPQLGRTRTPVAVAVGNAIPAEGTAESLTQTLRVAMLDLLEEVRTAYGHHPESEFWVPASMGGTAPTLEEANELERKEKPAKAADRQSKG